MTRKVALFVALFFVALTSGAAFAVWLDSSPSGLSPSFYVEKMQHAIRVFSVPLNTVAILGVIFTLASTFLARHDRPSLYLLGAASVIAIAATLITVFGNVPIINQMMTWNVTSPPSNWIEISARWWLLQMIRTILVIIELSLLLLSALVRRDISK
jgi:uncharacterized membrane protein